MLVDAAARGVVAECAFAWPVGAGVRAPSRKQERSGCHPHIEFGSRQREPVADPSERLARRSGRPRSTARADVAQLVEHFARNEGVRGSNPRVGSGESP